MAVLTSPSPPGLTRWSMLRCSDRGTYSVTLRCERSEPRRAAAPTPRPSPSRAAARPPQDDGERTSSSLLTTPTRPSFANAATIEVRRRAARRKRRGGACLFAVRYAHFAKLKKRKRNADRRFDPPAVLLARPRIQQDAHIYRRSTAVLTQGTRIPRPSSRPCFRGRGRAPIRRVPHPGQYRTQFVAGVTRPTCP